jgi:hypothetical protein
LKRKWIDGICCDECSNTRMVVSSLLIRADDAVGRSLLYGCLTRLFQRSERERERERERCVSQCHSLPLTRIAHVDRYLNRSSVIHGSSFIRAGATAPNTLLWCCYLQHQTRILACHPAFPRPDLVSTRLWVLKQTVRAVATFLGLILFLWKRKCS